MLALLFQQEKKFQSEKEIAMTSCSGLFNIPRLED